MAARFGGEERPESENVRRNETKILFEAAEN